MARTADVQIKLLQLLHAVQNTTARLVHCQEMDVSVSTGYVHCTDSNRTVYVQWRIQREAMGRSPIRPFGSQRIFFNKNETKNFINETHYRKNKLQGNPIAAGATLLTLLGSLQRSQTLLVGRGLLDKLIDGMINCVININHSKLTEIPRRLFWSRNVGNLQ